MNIIISGASGFLGTHLCSFLEKSGHFLTRLNSRNCNLCDEGSLGNFNKPKYDLIFHLAAWTQAGDFCLKHPAEQWVINQRINTNMLEWWQESQPQAKFIFIGTSCAYPPGGSLRETEFMTGEPIESLYTYAMTKRMLFQGAKAMEKQYGLKWLCAVPSTLYGSAYHLDGRQMHFIFDLIRKIIRGKEYGEKVILWGDGHQRRELVLVDDFVCMLWRLAESQENELFNVGAGEEYSIRAFADMICDFIGYNPKNIEYDTDRYTGAESKCLSIEKIKSVLPDYQLTPLKDGLMETINWFYQSKAFEINSNSHNQKCKNNYGYLQKL
jgi:GDP-L-fucose synthase